MDLQAVCDELYGLGPADFTPARDARAAEARRSGDRELSAAIKQLRRPSQSAWLANLLARERPHRVDELLAVGDRLREAQSRLAGEELKDLARLGHRVVAELVRDAQHLAAAAGQRPSPASLRQLQETLDAGLADPDSGRAVRAGHLSVALSYAGLGSPSVGPEAKADVDDPERRAAQRARAQHAAAERRVAELAAELQSAQRRRERIHDQIDELQRQLRQVQAQEAEVDQRIQQLEAGIVASGEAMRDTQRRVSRSPSQD